jgi:hypothetical protein
VPPSADDLLYNANTDAKFVGDKACLKTTSVARRGSVTPDTDPGPTGEIVKAAEVGRAAHG